MIGMSASAATEIAEGHHGVGSWSAELRSNLSRYLDRVQAGEEVVVTDRGRAIARSGMETSRNSTKGSLDSPVSSPKANDCAGTTRSTSQLRDDWTTSISCRRGRS
jgi:antitoxin (DNA-binding transcriptional repressor) of toxin-antitoxin stability system